MIKYKCSTCKWDMHARTGPNNEVISPLPNPPCEGTEGRDFGWGCEKFWEER